jgi:3',5'-cyclic AMP phosphodiesterase CpdA
MPLHIAQTRRQFITRSLAGGVAIFATRMGFGSESSEEPWALLSDTHIAADPVTVARNVNMAEHLRLAVKEVQALAGRGVRNVIVNGDCAYNHGEPGDYSTFIELTKPVVDAGQTLHCLLGNHDERDVFWNAFRAEQAKAKPVAGKQISVVESSLANWFLLDSLEVTNHTPGRLGEEQLKWLASALDARQDKPALVMVHHDALPRTDGKQAGLLDTEALLAALKPRRQVKALFYGHTHTWRINEVDGIHLINLPAVAYPFNPAEVTGWVECRVKKEGMRLQLSAFDKAHAQNGEVKEFTWRT